MAQTQEWGAGVGSWAEALRASRLREAASTLGPGVALEHLSMAWGWGGGRGRRPRPEKPRQQDLDPVWG